MKPTPSEFDWTAADQATVIAAQELVSGNRKKALVHLTGLLSSYLGWAAGIPLLGSGFALLASAIAEGLVSKADERLTAERKRLAAQDELVMATSNQIREDFEVWHRDVLNQIGDLGEQSEEQFLQTIRVILRESARGRAHIDSQLLRVIELLDQRLPRMSTTPLYQERFRKFTGEYAGSVKNPTPFGGRDLELRCLTEWLFDKSAPSRLLLTAPAGRGKSALLVRWLDQLAQHTTGHGAGEEPRTWRQVFIPISIRFGTNVPERVCQALAERLAEVLLEPLGHDPRVPYSDIVLRQLSDVSVKRTPLLVVLDGLDEALSYDFIKRLIPHDLGNARVVVSARLLAGDQGPEAWRRRLDWRLEGCETVDSLPSLGQESILELLREQPDPLCQLDEAVARRLFELTDGEPLLVRYYLEDLRQHLNLSDDPPHESARSFLNGRQRGYHAYFETWLEEHARVLAEQGTPNANQVDAVLSILAVALGPIASTELAAVAKRLPGVDIPFYPPRLVEGCKRFVLGTGAVDHGYVLAHSRLGEFLLSYYGVMIPEVRRQFIEWGRDQAEVAESDPNRCHEISPYNIRHHRQHLEEGEAHARDFLRLTTAGWRAAWLRLNEGTRGFAADVTVAHRMALANSGLTSVSDCLRCSIILSSIESTGAFLNSRVLVEGVRRGQIPERQGVEYGHMYDASSGDRTTVLIELADVVSHEMKLDVAREALAHLSMIEEQAIKASLVERVTRQLDAPTQREVLHIALELTNAYWRCFALAAFARAATSPSARSEAVAAAMDSASQVTTGGGSDRIAALAKLAPILDQQYAERAIALLITSELSWFPFDDLEGLHASFQADDIVALLLQLMPKLTDEWSTRVVEWVASEFRVGDRARVLAALPLEMPTVRRAIDSGLQALLLELDNSPPSHHHVKIFLALALALAPKTAEDALKILLQAIEAHPDPSERVELMLALAASRSTDVDLLIQSAYRSAVAIDAPLDARANALCSVLAAWEVRPPEHVIQEAWRAVREDDRRIRWRLGVLIPLLHEPEQSTAVAMLLQEINTEALHRRGEALAAYADILLTQAPRRAIEIATGCEHQAPLPFGRLFPALEGSLRKEALTSILRLPNRFRAPCLGAIAESLTDQELEHILPVAVGAGDSEARLYCIVNLGFSDAEAGQLVELARAANDPFKRIEVLLELGHAARNSTRQEVLSDALRTFNELPAGLQPLIKSLRWINIYPELEYQALRALAGIPDEQERAVAMWRLPDNIIIANAQPLRNFVRQMSDGVCRIVALSSLAAHLDESERAEAFRLCVATCARSRDAVLLFAIGRLMQYSTVQLRSRYAELALAHLAKTEGEGEVAAKVLPAISPWLSRKQLRKALALAESVANVEHRAAAIAAIASKLSMARVRKLARKCLRRTPLTPLQAATLCGLAPRLEPGLLRKATDIALASGSVPSAVRLLATLLPFAKGRQRYQAQEKLSRCVLADDVPGVDQKHLTACLGANMDPLSWPGFARRLATISELTRRFDILLSLLPQASDIVRESAIAFALGSLRELDLQARFELLIGLSGYLSANEGAQVLEECMLHGGRVQRQHLLALLPIGISALESEARESVSRSVVEAIVEVGQWYP